MEAMKSQMTKGATPTHRKRRNNVYDSAVAMLQAGFSVLPCNHHDKFHNGDDPKKPTVNSWTPYQKKPMVLAAAKKHFVNGVSIGVICGKVSGNLECLDFDQPDLYKPFMETLTSINPGLVAGLVKRQTPSGGYHLIYRGEAPVSGSQKLALTENGKSTLIETRGEGAYFLTTPSPGYKVMERSLLDVPTLSTEEVDLLHSIAKSFTEKQEPVRVQQKHRVTVDGTRPGDDFNSKCDFPDLLESNGWHTTGRVIQGREHWTRPGKKTGSNSATLNELGLFVFSSNAGLPTGPNNAFSVYTHYNHGGNYSAAAKELARQGYGEKDIPVPKREYKSSNGLSSHSSLSSQDADEWEPEVNQWPELKSAALSGIAGQFVELATRESEADPAAVLATFLARFAIEVGSGINLWVGDTKHYARLFSVIVGASSKARKGTSAQPVEKLFRFGVGDHIPAKTSPGPFSSGEGIIYAVRDEVKDWHVDKKTGVGEYITKDPGVEDKRLFVLDEEFGGVLSVTKREGNTLSTILRTSWDSGNLDPLTKNNKIRATGAHIGWVSHIVRQELEQKLSASESFNGFANRILWVCAKRQKHVALPQPMPEPELRTIQNRMLDLVNSAQNSTTIKLHKEAETRWIEVYPELSKDYPGLVGCVINRGEAQTLRLAMIYALLDGRDIITIDHLESALAFWAYCRDSAKYIFHGKEEDNKTQKLLDALEEGPLTGTELYGLFGNHISKKTLEMILQDLVSSGKILSVQEQTSGKPRTVYMLAKKEVIEI